MLHKGCPNQDCLEALQLLNTIPSYFYHRKCQAWVHTYFVSLFFPTVMIKQFPCPESIQCQPNCIFQSSKLRITQILPPVTLALFRIWWFPDINEDKNCQTENVTIKKKKKKRGTWAQRHLLASMYYLSLLTLDIGYANEYFPTFQTNQKDMPHLSHLSTGNDCSIHLVHLSVTVILC